MNQEQIEEMANDISESLVYFKGEPKIISRYDTIVNLIAKGYRKQSENTIELPCNVGDWLWYVYRNEINKAKVEEIRYDASKHGYYSYSFTAYAYDFKNKRQVSYYPPNETTKNDANINKVEGMGYDEEVYVFLSKNEAEAKMKGEKG
mgnify:CR=1 FL=1